MLPSFGPRTANGPHDRRGYCCMSLAIYLSRVRMIGLLGVTMPSESALQRLVRRLSVALCPSDLHEANRWNVVKVWVH